MTDLIQFKHSVKRHEFVFSLIKKLTDKVKSVEHFESLKMSPEITRTLASIVKEECSHLKKKDLAEIDGRHIVKEALKCVFELNDQELSQVDAQLDFLTDNKMIKKVSLKKRLGRILYALLRLW